MFQSFLTKVTAILSTINDVLTVIVGWLKAQLMKMMP